MLKKNEWLKAVAAKKALANEIARETALLIDEVKEEFSVSTDAATEMVAANGWINRKHFRKAMGWC